MAQLRQQIVKIAFDVSCLLLVGIPILIFKLAVTPYQRGFWCNDESINLRFKDSTVNNVALYFIGLAIPVVSFTAVEFLRFREEKKQQSNHFLGPRRIPILVWRLYKVIGVYLFGACVSQLTTDIGKYSVGRLRPHFLQVCWPGADINIYYNMCSQRDPKIYIEGDKFHCTGNENMVREARLSFPSGHSSFTFFAMVYLALYLQARLNWRFSKLFRPTVQFLALCLALYTSLSRISDHKHHWSDVLSGAVQGGVVALIIVFFVSGLFKRETLREGSIEDGDANSLPIKNPDIQSSTDMTQCVAQE